MSVVLLAACPTCQEVRYRSRAFEVGESPSAADFVPLTPETPPAQGDIPLCYICQAVLRIGPEGPPVPRNQSGSAHSRPAGVETLFAVDEGETVKDMQFSPPYAYVFTDKRIVRILI